MMKALNKSRSKWKALLVTVVVVVGICLFVDWIWDTYGQDYALTWVALFIAVIVAIVALWSLKMTRESLELTRATTRPFLTSRLGVELGNKPFELGNKPEINTQVRNTGIHPADNVLVTVELCAEPDGPSEEKILKQYTEPRGAVFFPNQELWYTMVIDAEDVKSIEAHKTYVRVAIDYQYRLLGTEHKTVETKRLTRHLTSGQIIHTVIPEKSSWY